MKDLVGCFEDESVRRCCMRFCEGARRKQGGGGCYLCGTVVGGGRGCARLLLKICVVFL